MDKPDQRTVLLGLRDVATRRMAVGFDGPTPVLALQATDFDAITGIAWLGVDADGFENDAALLLVSETRSGDGAGSNNLILRIPGTPAAMIPVLAEGITRSGYLDVRKMRVSFARAGVIDETAEPVRIPYRPYVGTSDED